MLIRVSGKLSDNAPFSFRKNSVSALAAVIATAAALEAAGRTDVVSINAAPVAEFKEISFGDAKTAEQIAQAKAERKAKKEKKAAAAATAAPVPAAKPKSGGAVDSATATGRR